MIDILRWHFPTCKQLFNDIIISFFGHLITYFLIFGLFCESLRVYFSSSYSSVTNLTSTNSNVQKEALEYRAKKLIWDVKPVAQLFIIKFSMINITICGTVDVVLSMHLSRLIGLTIEIHALLFVECTSNGFRR